MGIPSSNYCTFYEIVHFLSKFPNTEHFTFNDDFDNDEIDNVDMSLLPPNVTNLDLYLNDFGHQLLKFYAAQLEELLICPSMSRMNDFGFSKDKLEFTELKDFDVDGISCADLEYIVKHSPKLESICFHFGWRDFENKLNALFRHNKLTAIETWIHRESIPSFCDALSLVIKEHHSLSVKLFEIEFYIHTRSFETTVLNQIDENIKRINNAMKGKSIHWDI